MSIKTPSSLFWLVNKYKSTAAELSDVEARMAPLRAKKTELSELLNALAEVLKSHDIPVNASEIPTKRFYGRKLSIKHGLITRKIYEALKAMHRESGVYLHEIIDYIADDLNYDFSCKSEKDMFRHIVRKRINSLTRQQKIEIVQRGVARKVEPKFRSI